MANEDDPQPIKKTPRETTKTKMGPRPNERKMKARGTVQSHPNLDDAENTEGGREEQLDRTKERVRKERVRGSGTTRRMGGLVLGDLIKEWCMGVGRYQYGTWSTARGGLGERK